MRDINETNVKAIDWVCHNRAIRLGHKNLVPVFIQEEGYCDYEPSYY